MLKKALIRFLASSTRRVITREKPRIVAITGSYGKSSVKEAIAIALGSGEPGSRVISSPKNYNNEFGLPFTVLGVAAPGRDPVRWLFALARACWMGWGFGRVRANAFVLEMGADRPGDLAWLTGIATPDVAVVTAVGEAHSEFFGSIDGIAKEKATVVRALKKDGFAVLNNDDALVTAMRRETEAESAYFGFSDGSDIRVLRTAPAVIEDEDGHAVPVGIDVALAIASRAGESQVSELHLHGTIGQPQALAAAAAIAVARRFDVPLETAFNRLEQGYHGIAGRTRIIPGIKGTSIIDDSYNAASPETVVSALRDLARLPLNGNQRRIAAIGEMRELGEYSDAAHRSVGRAVVESGIDVLVTCGTLARGTADEALAAGFDASRIRRFETSADAGRFLQDLIKTGDVLLVKGSQGMRMERIVKELMAEPNEAPFLLVRMTEDWVGR
jgi:UDP-N-acetylmuramoyl-tripeptide--D-alanyl-D-alanine ligase